MNKTITIWIILLGILAGIATAVCTTPIENATTDINVNTDFCAGTYLNVSIRPSQNNIYFNCTGTTFIGGVQSGYKWINMAYYKKYGVVIKNCKVIGRQVGMGIYVGLQNHTLISNMTITNFSEGIEIDTATNLNTTIINSNISGSNGCLANVMVYSFGQINFLNSHFDSSLNASSCSTLPHGIYLSPITTTNNPQIVINNCTFIGNINEGLRMNRDTTTGYIGPVNVTNSTFANEAIGSDTYGCLNCYYYGNYFYNNSNAGLTLSPTDNSSVNRIYHTENSTFNNNVFYNNNVDIKVYASAGNQLINTTYTPNITILRGNVYSSNLYFYNDTINISINDYVTAGFRINVYPVNTNTGLYANYNGKLNANIVNTLGPNILNITIFNQSTQFPYNDIYNIALSSIISSNIDNYTTTLSATQQIGIGEYSAKAYYVSNLTGSDSNTGTLASPFATPTKAFLTAANGDTIYIRTGNYTNSNGYIIQNKTGITIAGYNNEDARLLDYIQSTYSGAWTNQSAIIQGMWSIPTGTSTTMLSVAIADTNQTLFIHSSYYNMTQTNIPAGCYHNSTAQILYCKFDNLSLNPNNYKWYLSKVAILSIGNLTNSRIENLTFVGGQKGIAVKNPMETYNLTIFNSDFIANTGATSVSAGTGVIDIRVSANTTIYGNYIEQLRLGLWDWKTSKGHASESTAIRIENNTDGTNISGNTITSIFNGIGVLSSVAGKNNGAIVAYNNLTNIYDDAIELEEWGMNEYIHNNYINDTYSAVSIIPFNNSAGTTRIEYNILQANKYVYTQYPDSTAHRDYGNGIKLAGGVGDRASWINITQNTIIGRGMYAMSTQLHVLYNTTIMNNIFYQPNTSRILDKTGLQADGVFIDHNLYFKVDGSGILRYYDSDTISAEYTTLAAAKATGRGSTWDTGSIQSNPYLNYSNGLAPAPNSPACGNSSNGSYMGAVPCLPPNFTDTYPPTFINIPANISIDSSTNSSWNVQFYATDDGDIDSFSANDSQFNMSKSGNLSRTGLLSVGIYYLNISVNDTTNKQASIIFTVTVSGSVLTIISPTYNQQVQRYLNMSWSSSVNTSYYEVNLLDEFNNFLEAVAQKQDYYDNKQPFGNFVCGARRTDKIITHVDLYNNNLVNVSWIPLQADGHYGSISEYVVYYYSDGSTGAGGGCTRGYPDQTLCTGFNPDTSKLVDGIDLIGSATDFDCVGYLTLSITGRSTVNQVTDYDFFPLNLDPDIYGIQVIAYDSIDNVLASTIQPFNLTANALLNVSALDIYNNAAINTFNISITDASGHTDYYNTTNGNIQIYAIQNAIYTLNITSLNYQNSSQNVTVDSQYKNVVFQEAPTNSLVINTYLESNNNFLNASFNLNFVGLLSQFNYTLNYGHAVIQNIPSDTYTITFTNPSYSPRTYVVTTSSGSSTNLNAYLGNGSAIGMYVYDYSNVPLTAVVNIEKLVNQSYVTITQATTDLTGYTSLYLLDGTIYRITITSNGFTTKTASFTPYYANQPYTFKLLTTTSSPFVSPNYFVAYNIYPSVTYLNHTSTIFGIQLSSPQGMIQYGRITCNGQSNYVTGSPSGLSAQVTLDLTAYNGLIQCQYEYQLTGYFPTYMNRTYYVTDYAINQNNTAMSGIQNFVRENNNDAWSIIIGMFILIVITVLFFQITQNPIISTVTVIAGTLIMGIIGLFPMGISIIVVVIGIGWLYFSQR